MPKIAESTRSARREQILAAASVCFARTGYHATTMADVAAQAGLSKGTPYLYFASKEDLYVALHNAWDCALADRVDTEIARLSAAERASPRQVLRAVAMAVGAHVAEQEQTCRVLMEARTLAGYHPTIAAAVHAADARARQPLQRLIRAGIEAGQWPPDTDPGLQARLITATLHGLMAQWHLTPGSFSWAEAADAIAAGARYPMTEDDRGGDPRWMSTSAARPCRHQTRSRLRPARAGPTVTAGDASTDRCGVVDMGPCSPRA